MDTGQPGMQPGVCFPMLIKHSNTEPHQSIGLGSSNFQVEAVVLGTPN